MKIKNKFTAKTLGSFLLLSSVLVLSNCTKDEETIVDNAPVKQISSTIETTPTTTTPTPTSTTSTFNLESALPAGYVTDGSVDYTSYIQSAINQNSNVTFPGFPILVNSKGILVPSNRVLSFLPGSEIRLKPTSATGYVIFKLEKVTNVTINDIVIVGDKKTHLGTSGEWGMGIGIYSSSNITLNRPKISDCWGDGIYLGTTAGVVNRNIVIRNAYLRANRRDGISIISVDGLLIDTIYAGYHTEKNPYSGINIEPNYHYDEIKNVTINNVTSEYNAGQGVQLALKGLYGGSDKFITANVNGLTDVGSRIAFKISANTSYRKGTESINGKLYIRNVNSSDYTYIPVMVATADEAKLKTIFTKPKAKKIGSSTYLSDASFTSLFKGSCVARGSLYSLYF